MGSIWDTLYRNYPIECLSTMLSAQVHKRLHKFSSITINVKLQVNNRFSWGNNLTFSLINCCY